MWTLEKTFLFEASHQLPNHDGKCKRVHGHSWKATLICESSSLQSEGPKRGMVEDFGVISAAMNPIIENYLDHWHLNETTKLPDPTSEALSKWIFDKVKPSVPLLIAVRVDETCTGRCTYRP